MGFSLVQINEWKEIDIDPKITYLFTEHSININKITEISWSEKLRKKKQDQNLLYLTSFHRNTGSLFIRNHF